MIQIHKTEESEIDSQKVLIGPGSRPYIYVALLFIHSYVQDLRNPVSMWK